jgi:hypothetical protein
MEVRGESGQSRNRTQGWEWLSSPRACERRVRLALAVKTATTAVLVAVEDRPQFSYRQGLGEERLGVGLAAEPLTTLR